ncbi:sulfurtransferase [Acetobacter okinawensis]|uniref:sulfurtransferase n=1 Tax=Acetobacter okinawensis TaxID=1076594 RepID=UPI00054E98FE|nr:rhodanese-like domain-containing protein [Acetobacter okinawensis]
MAHSISSLISVAELSERRQDPSLAIFDTSVVLPSPRFDGDYRVESGQAQWCEGHIPNARHLDLTHDLADTSQPFSFALPPLEDLAIRFATQGITPQITPVLYDKTDGFWAARLWWMLRSVGVTARILDGGYSAWQNAGQPTATKNSLPELENSNIGERSHSIFTLQPRLWCDRQRVLRIVNGSENGTLICALSKTVFDGTSPTRYSRRGHIPHSLNLPARSLLNAQGFYQNVQELQSILQPFLTHKPLPLVLYCGGGISAAVVAVALVLVGQFNTTLYDGSLQEWSADPELPLVTNSL